MRPWGCPETSVRNYGSTLRNIPEERRSRLHRGGSLKSRMDAWIGWSFSMSEEKGDSVRNCEEQIYGLVHFEKKRIYRKEDPNGSRLRYFSSRQTGVVMKTTNTQTTGMETEPRLRKFLYCLSFQEFISVTHKIWLHSRAVSKNWALNGTSSSVTTYIFVIYEETGHSFVDKSNSQYRCRWGKVCGRVPDWGCFLPADLNLGTTGQ